MRQPDTTTTGYLSFNTAFFFIFLLFSSFSLQAQNQELETPCSNYVTIECGVLIDDTTVGASNDFDSEDYASCQNFDLVFDFEGPDKVFKVNKSDSTSYLSIVMKHDRFTNLTLFVADACTGDEIGCLYKGTNIMNGKDVIGEYFVESDPPLPPGDYYIIVDGFHDEQEGAFWLMATCQPTPCPDQVFILTEGSDDVSFTPSPEPISCGQTVEGNTSELENKYSNESYSGCMNFNLSFSFDAPDQIYQITKEENFGPLNIHLFHSNEINLSLFLFEACGDGAMSCIARGENMFDEQGNPIGEQFLDDLEPLPKGDYLIVVDGYDADQHGAYSLTATCGVLDCTGAPELFCGDVLSNESNDNGANNVSVYLCDGNIHSGYTGNEKVYKFELTNDELRTVTIKLSGFATSQNLDLFLLKEWCAAEKCIADSRRVVGNDEQIGPLQLSKGQYFVVVDGFADAISSFSISIEAKCERVMPSICDVGGVYLDQGALIEEALNTSLDVAPLALKNDSCIMDFYSALLWLKDTLYTDSYIYYHENDGFFEPILTGNASINTQLFVYQCQLTDVESSSFDNTVQSGYTTTRSCFSNFESAPRGLYYIVVVSNKADTYTLEITPGGDCGGLYTTINLDESFIEIEGDLAEQCDNFNTIKNDTMISIKSPERILKNSCAAPINALESCYGGTNSYTGADDLYQLVVDEAKSVVIELQSSSQMILALFDHQCASTCLDYDETNNEGIAVLSTFLSRGVYYLLVDKATGDGPSTYNLRASSFVTAEIHADSGQDDSETCDLTDAIEHKISLNANLDQTSQINGNSLQTQDQIYFGYFDRGIIENQTQLTWNGVQENISVFSNVAIEGDKCGFDNLEKIRILVSQDQGEFGQFAIADFNSASPLSPDRDRFNSTPNTSRSNIIKLIADSLTAPITLGISPTPPIYARPQGRNIEILLTPNFDYTISTIYESSSTNWLNIRVNGTIANSGSPGENVLDIEVLPNPEQNERVATIRIISSMGSMLHEVKITQGVSNLFAFIEEPDTLNCQLDTVVLNGTQSSNSSKLNYIWSSSDGQEIIIDDIDPRIAYVVEKGTYTLTIEGSDAPSMASFSRDVEIDTVVVTAEAGENQTIYCVGDSVTLSGQASSIGNGISYLWTSKDGKEIINPTNIQTKVDTPGVYYLMVTNSKNFCFSIDSVIVSANDTLLVATSILTADTIENNLSKMTGQINIEVTGGEPKYYYEIDSAGNVLSSDTMLTSSVIIESLKAGIYQLVIKDSNMCTDTAQFKIDSIIISNLIQRVNKAYNKVVLFPNPASDIIYLDQITGDFELEIVNHVGQVVHIAQNQYKQMKNGIIGIDLSPYRSGIYYLIIESEKQKFVNKFIINK